MEMAIKHLICDVGGGLCEEKGFFLESMGKIRNRPQLINTLGPLI